MIVTIDGPAGSGKSTAARLLAQRLGFDFLDTGAMYRAVALKCLAAGVDLNDAQRVAEIARGIRIEALGPSVRADGVDVTEAIRTAEVSTAASRVAANPGVRAALVAMQREAAAGRNVVAEGRDQGTVVFPQAECKFFITAAPDERARRRQAELREQGEDVPFDELVAQIRERDTRDETRATAPLRAAADAVLIDSSNLSSEEVARRLEEAVRRAQRGGPRDTGADQPRG
jgi:cytidylate kinase